MCVVRRLERRVLQDERNPRSTTSSHRQRRIDERGHGDRDGDGAQEAGDHLEPPARSASTNPPASPGTAKVESKGDADMACVDSAATAPETAWMGALRRA